LDYKRNRQYDPVSGRFTQEDPIGLAGGLNLYGFADSDPVNFSDPFGLLTCPPLCGDRYEALQRPLIGEELLLLPFALGAGIYRSIFGAGARAAAVEGAAAAGAGFATKSAARGALAEMALPEVQAAAVNRAIGRATTRTVIGITQGEGGNVVVTLTRAGRSGKQVIESVISPDGAKTVVQRAYDAAGRLVHLDPKP
jgi:uncharacterized protein RhaS with RHS repeats